MNGVQTAGQALTEYYKSHYFGDKAQTDKWVWVNLIGPISLPFPNSRRRREIIYIHDLHHIVTGYTTDWTGEGEVAAWELASGFPAGFRSAYFYAPVTFLIGVFVSPLRVIKAFRRGIGQKNICHLKMSRKRIISLTIDEIRRELGLV